MQHRWKTQCKNVKYHFLQRNVILIFVPIFFPLLFLSHSNKNFRIFRRVVVMHRERPEDMLCCTLAKLEVIKEKQKNPNFFLLNRDELRPVKNNRP